ncbi:glycoside hydrolase family 130 protein [Sphingomonas bacterium]|uniref:glycoside hydrolase family 130 protein n=1 Tax=Sphingomonas bacterium TaxID=1895847 RepID=UPI001575D5BC|nr:glycoside hydrolase family 130 protein [Sphingomonas bacterium]
MATTDLLQHSDVILRPDPSRTVVRPFDLGYPGRFADAGPSRTQVIVDRITSLDEARLDAELRGVTRSLDERHRDVDATLRRRFEAIAGRITTPRDVSDRQQRLIGAYFSEEYSFEAAALFNPSAVPHPDQSGLPDGAIRFVLSLRGIGEGHVSSVAFRTGVWMPGGAVTVDPPSPSAVPPEVGIEDGEGRVRLDCGASRSICETVIFPVLPRQRQGIEDVRLVRFTDDDGTSVYHGTYTAFSGADAKPELLSSGDFTSMEMRPLTGDAAGAKGMALFPRRVDGRFLMLGRQDSESIWLHRSDELYRWNGGARLVRPRYPWEFVQMGNCGSPLEVDEGWLVFTHGVGTVRNYCMGACLLDKADPSKLLARTPAPILEPSPGERDGYVPNVVYGCGAMLSGRDVLIPYGVADNFTSFATTTVDGLLGAME